MPNSHSAAAGRADTHASTPDAPVDRPTLHEFLTRLVQDPAARSEFDADPHTALDQAGFGDMTATDVLQASSLVLDYAPVEIVAEYNRALQTSVDKFATNSQQVAINQLHPAPPQEQEEPMMHTQQSHKPAFDDKGDVDQQLSQQKPTGGNDTDVHVEQNDSHNLVNVHDVGTGGINVAAVGNEVGNVANNTVDDVTHTVNHTVDTGAGLAAGAPAALPTHDLPVDDLAGNLPVDDVADKVGDVAEALPTHDLPVNDLAGNLPTHDVASHLPAPSDLPVVGDVAGGPVEDVASHASHVLPDGVL